MALSALLARCTISLFALHADNCVVGRRPKPISKLRSDQKLNALINIMLPEVVQKDKAQEEEFKRSLRKPGEQSGKTKAGPFPPGLPIPMHKACRRDKRHMEQIAFELRPNKDCPKERQFPALDSPFLMTANTLRIGKIRKHVAKHLNVTDPDQVGCTVDHRCFFHQARISIVLRLQRVHVMA